MQLDAKLLEVLVCPESKAPLVYFEQEGFLLCPQSRLKYRVDDGIPVMLIDEAERLDQGEVDRLLADAVPGGLA